MKAYRYYIVSPGQPTYGTNDFAKARDMAADQARTVVDTVLCSQLLSEHEVEEIEELN